MLKESCCSHCSEIYRKRPRCKSLKCPEYLEIKKQKKEIEKMNNRKKIVRFFKRDGKWYADIPNHTLEENEMVMGSDMLLEAISNSIYCMNPNDFTIELIDEKVPYAHTLNLERVEHDEDGAYYNVHGLLHKEFLKMMGIDEHSENDKIWICNVTHDIFDEHPEFITILNIR